MAWNRKKIIDFCIEQIFPNIKTWTSFLRHKWKIVFKNLDFLQRKTWDSFGESRKIANKNMKQSFSKLNYFAKSIATNRCFEKNGLVSTAMDDSQKKAFLKNI